MNAQFWTSLRDISATSRKFTSEDIYSVNSSFRDIEENFHLFPEICSCQNLIFAKRLYLVQILVFRSTTILLEYVPVP
ncbi:UNVERIFIED_CONTAM: hypothetical protein NCL1_25265 [Trichonephila clavipes]